MHRPPALRRSLPAALVAALLLFVPPALAAVEEPTAEPSEEPSDEPSVDVPFVDRSDEESSDDGGTQQDAPTDPQDDQDDQDGQDGGQEEGTTGDPDEAPGGGDADTGRRRTPTREARTAPSGDACSRGQYGEVLDDGTVDVGCDGVLTFAEQRSPVTLHIDVRARPGEQVAITVDERDVAGRVLRVDPVSTRGGSVERFPLLYRAPDGLDGRDGFSLWVSRDGYEREVRVVVEVRRSTVSGAAGPTRGVLLGGSGDGEQVDVALSPAPGGLLGPVTTVLALVSTGLVVLLVAWVLLRRRGVRLPVLDEDPERPTSTTFVAGA